MSKVTTTGDTTASMRQRSEKESLRAVAEAVFPLKLTPFERYMVAEDRPDYPMSYDLVVECEGVVDREILESALENALVVHPLMTARLDAGFRASYWHLPASIGPRVHWNVSQKDIDDGVAVSPRLADGQGVELYVRRSGTKTELHFHVHHALCDGMGVFAFIRELLSSYHRGGEFAVDSFAERRRAIEDLSRRGDFETPAPRRITRWEAIRGLWAETKKVLHRRPRPLAVNRSKPLASTHDGGLTCHCRLTPVATLGIQAAAKRMQATVNDVLIRDLFMTIRDWNERIGAAHLRGSVRICVPTDLRYSALDHVSSANIVGYALITRRFTDCDDPGSLLAGINADMRAVRDWGLGALFVNALRKVDRVPGLLSATCRRSRRFTTTVLSNLGNIHRTLGNGLESDNHRIQAADVTVTNVYCTPPVRPGTRVALVVGRYDGRWNVSLRFDPQWLTRGEATEFLDAYRKRLERTAGQDRTSQPDA